MMRMNSASVANLSELFLAARDSKVKNGNANCRITIAKAITPQPPCLRATYQAVSSGKMPDQISKYCENAKYVHDITSASRRLPQYCKRLRRATLSIHGHHNRHDVD